MPNAISYHSLPDELIKYVSQFTIEQTPYQSPLYDNKRKLMIISYRQQLLRMLNTRHMELLPQPEPITFQMPAGLCSIS